MSIYKDFLQDGGEKKWQDYWEERQLFAASDDATKPKYYVLIEFPYPSGEGLHVGHPRSYSALDTVARKRRMQGYNVLYPIGFDAFGLPAENFAIKTGIHPKIKTEENIANFRRQLKSIGFSFDWTREVNTTDPKYYQWTQWIFLQLFKRGLAYKMEMPINYCTSCKVGLANEEVVGGNCERCGSEVIKKTKSQWMLRITDYAQRLADDLDQVNFLDKIKAQQRNWIGRSEGAEVDFTVQGSEEKIKVYTTRPDTLFGATYMVLAPEHELVGKLSNRIANLDEVNNYIAQAKNKSDLERTELNKEKSGVELKGVTAINPATGREIPIWLSDYVLASYGTGAIMAVPAHDERDYEFAKKFDLPIIEVIEPEFGEKKDNEEFKERIVALVYDPSKEKVLMLDWGEKYGGHLLVGGGIETGEDVIETAKREIAEETGYTNLKFIAKSETCHHHYVAHNKGVNRGADITGLYFELVNEDKIETKLTEAEKDKFTVSWVDKAKAVGLIKDPLHNYLANKFLFGGAYVDVDRGVMTNSEFLNGLVPEEAIGKMTAWLTEKGVGKKAVNFKLRDWVFSRQRYWGEPIPLVYCNHCKNKKQKVLMIHGFEGSGEGNWFSWMKTELEKQGFEVFNPTMTTAGGPVLEKWLEELTPYLDQMDSDDIIIGHSLGSKAALHLLEKTGKKIGHLYLVGSVLQPASDADYARFQKLWGTSDDSLELLKKFNATPFNLEKIAPLAENKVILQSTDDIYITQATHENIPADWMIMTWQGFGHFQAKQIPELLNLISRCKNTGWVPLAEQSLPLELPEVKQFQAGEDGESPLAKLTDWIETICPHCGGPAKRETDTMPQWAGSSWYFLRYIDPHDDAAFAAPDKLKYWLKKSTADNSEGVDWYNGGMEHTTLHLLYSRFWHKFLYDIGAVPTAEPYTKRTSHGMVLGESGEKMSKSRGNVVNPDDVVREFGADTLRIYEMFMGPFDQAIPWDTKGVVGVRRFLDRVWVIFDFADIKLVDEVDAELEILLNKSIKKVGEDIENLGYNTAVSQLMILVNKIYEKKQVSRDVAEKLVLILSPFAPHLAEELWHKLGHESSVSEMSWPDYDEDKLKDEEMDLPVQVNGKVRAKLRVATEIEESEAVALALADQNVQRFVLTAPKKIIFVKGKMVSIVI